MNDEDTELKNKFLAELPRLKELLSQEHSPEKFASIYEETEHYGHHSVTASGTIPLKEAWLARGFALKRKADGVRLIAADRPDFCLRVQGQEYSYEVVQFVGNRKPDLEVKEVFKVGTLPDYGENTLSIDQAIEGVLTSIADKMDSRYHGVSGLFVYLNVRIYNAATVGDNFVELIERLRIMPFNNKIFQEIWVCYSTHCDWIRLPEDWPFSKE